MSCTTTISYACNKLFFNPVSLNYDIMIMYLISPYKYIYNTTVRTYDHIMRYMYIRRSCCH